MAETEELNWYCEAFKAELIRFLLKDGNGNIEFRVNCKSRGIVNMNVGTNRCLQLSSKD